MRMIVDVGVKVAFRAINRDFLHQPHIAERAQCVVNRRKRHAFTATMRRRKQAFRCDVAIFTIPHQQIR